MLKIFVLHDNMLKQAAGDNPLHIPAGAIWIDLLEPTLEEEKAVEDFLHIDIPTREEMNEIELSSRLYEENNALYLTATLITKVDLEPENSAVTFVLTEGRLVTIRYVDPQPFRAFIVRCERIGYAPLKGEVVFVGLMEAIVDRIADILQGVGRNVDSLSFKIFRPRATSSGVADKYDFQDILEQIGKNGDLVSKTRESIVSVLRLIAFVTQAATNNKMEEINHRLSTVVKDIPALSDHATFLANKVNFLLDATLGMISIEQNTTIKIVSVAAVVFLPPTLIASVYGMNFQHMPELEWLVGYPLAVVLMVLSAYLPYRYFKRKGWL